MTKISLRTRILEYLRKQEGFCNGGELEKLAFENGFKGSNASRRLRELHEDKLIERNDTLDKKRTVWYRATKPKEVIKYYVPKLNKEITKSIW